MRRSVTFAVIIVIALVGVVDSIRTTGWTAAVMFAAVAALAVGGLLDRHRATAIRADHHAWLVRTASVTGEPVEQIADRAIGAYRDAQ